MSDDKKNGHQGGLRAGRFVGGSLDSIADDFNASIRFDQRMYREDIRGSIAHARMLSERGIISRDDAERIIGAIRDIELDIEAGRAEFSIDAEDIHMNIESMLTERIGEPGKRLHTARSRNDQTAVDLRMYVRDNIDSVREMLMDLIDALTVRANDNVDTVMPGYTHLQRAQPITLAHHLLAYCQMFMRDVTRLEDCRARMNYSPLGSCALAGTTYPIDRDMTARELGFTAPTSNSLDGVSDRDFVIETLSALSMIMMHLSRASEEIILWCSWEFRFIELSDAYSTGSSIMPQKKNPDMAELIRGKTGRVYGSLLALLTTMKALPLAYNKDMQEDKEQIFDALDTVKMCLPVFTGMISTMKVNAPLMRSAVSDGYVNATDAADYLTKRGIPFRDAYTLLGRLVRECSQSGRPIEAMTLDELKSISPVFEEDIYDAISPETCVSTRGSHGGPAAEESLRQIDEARRFVKDRRK